MLLENPLLKRKLRHKTGIKREYYALGGAYKPRPTANEALPFPAPKPILPAGEPYATIRLLSQVIEWLFTFDPLMDGPLIIGFVFWPVAREILPVERPAPRRHFARGETGRIAP